ncbi:MAG: peptidylprolyl isomerase [Bacteroidota bacterium]|nr:peptidylprolyl isomerase [Bacteroidota bacterium]
MATLQTIRDRAGLLIAIIIGLAILAFVLGDFLGGGNSQAMGMKKKLEIAEVANQSISYLEYDKRISDLTEIYKLSGNTSMDEQTSLSIRQQTWDQMIREFVMSGEYKKLGLGVSSEELFDLIQGDNPHQYVRQLFTDQQTGIFDRGALIRFLKNMESDPTGNQKKYWMFMETQIDDEHMFNKYLTLIQKGLYVNSNQVSHSLSNSNKQVDFKYIVQRYSSIPDSVISIKEDELKKYYNEHQDNYEQTASRNVEYVSFEVKPSGKDIKDTEDWINDIKSEFENTSVIPQFVNANSDLPYDFRNYKQGELPEVINDFMFENEEGASFGPYFENESYKLARLSEINYLPDSVHARHILISPSAERSAEAASQMADSLKRLLESGTDFAILALMNSDDQGSAQLGGDLGWFNEGSMVQPFNDACFKGSKGEVVLAESQFGWHIIEILEQGTKVKKVQVGIVTRAIQASTATYELVYSEASRFAGINNSYEKFIASIDEDEGLTKRIANDIKEDDRQIPGLESPRELIRAMYQSELNNIVLDLNKQAVFELENVFVVAYLTDVKEKGIAPFDQVKTDVEFNVRNDKKAVELIQTLENSMAEISNIEDLAETLNTRVEEVSGINFNSFSIPGAGIEPALIGTVVGLSEGTISQPVKGLNGVYIAVVTSINENTDLDEAFQKNSLISNFSNRVNFEVYNALLEIANVVDKRSKFY